MQHSASLIEIIGGLFPTDTAPLTHWQHYIEATIGLNVLSEIYRRIFEHNIDWVHGYAERKRKWIVSHCENLDDLEVVLKRITDMHTNAAKTTTESSINISFLFVLLGLFLLYLSSIHTALMLPPFWQFIMAVVLFLPIPFALFSGLCLMCFTGAFSTFYLRQYYAEAVELWGAKQFALLSVSFERASGWLLARASRHRRKK